MQDPLALDIGCGEGVYLTKLSSRGYSIIGLDINRQRLHKTKKISAVVCASSSNLPFREQAFDLISMQYIIHHIKAPDTTLREVSKVSKPHGVLDIAELVEDNPLFKLARDLHPSWENDPVYTRLYRSDIQQLLSRYASIDREDLSLGHFWWIWWIITTHFVVPQKVDKSRLNRVVCSIDTCFGKAFKNKYSCKYNATLHLKEVTY